MPTAVYCSFVPRAMVELGEETWIELSVALLIPRVVEPWTPPKVAVRLTVPREMAVARPNADQISSFSVDKRFLADR